MIAAKVANALALDYPRERLELIVASDGSADATAERARAAGADLVLELPPRRQGRRPERRRRAGRRRDPRLLRRQQRLGAGRPAPPRRPLRRPGGRLRLRPGPLPRRRRRQPRGRLLALRDGGARDGVGAGRGHRRQRRDLRGARATPTSRSPPSGSHDLSLPLRASPSAACARSTRPAPRAEEKMVPTLEGEFARKRRMMVGLWDIVVGEGMLSPARLPAALRLRARLPPAAALPDARSSTWSPSSPTSPCSASGWVYVAHLRRPARRCSPPRCSAAPLPARRRCASPATT